MLGSGFIIPSTFNASPARTIRASSFSPACLPITFHQSLITQEYLGADHPFCTAAFCCPRFRRRRFAFACFALPRRHRSTARTALGRHDESVGDQFLRCSLSLLHLPDLLLARAHFAICPGWAGGWRPSRVARFSIDPLGKPPGRIYSQPLARPSHHADNRSTSCLRLVAHHAPRRARRTTLVFVGVRDPTFCCRRCGLDRLLFGLRHRSACSSHAPRETAS